MRWALVLSRIRRGIAVLNDLLYPPLQALDKPACSFQLFGLLVNHLAQFFKRKLQVRQFGFEGFYALFHEDMPIQIQSDYFSRKFT
jgi:hypothetical protein